MSDIRLIKPYLSFDEVELDFQDYDFLFFDEPFCYYSLKGITSKINSFQQLTYYAEVFLFLNPDIET